LLKAVCVVFAALGILAAAIAVLMLGGYFLTFLVFLVGGDN